MKGEARAVSAAIEGFYLGGWWRAEMLLHIYATSEITHSTAAAVVAQETTPKPFLRDPK